MSKQDYTKDFLSGGPFKIFEEVIYKSFTRELTPYPD